MAINPNEQHENRHTLVIGQSGSGFQSTPALHGRENQPCGKPIIIQMFFFDKREPSIIHQNSKTRTYRSPVICLIFHDVIPFANMSWFVPLIGVRAPQTIKGASKSVALKQPNSLILRDRGSVSR